MAGEIKFYLGMFKKTKKYGGHILRQAGFWLKKGKPRCAVNYIWDILLSQEEGAGILDPLYVKFPSLAPFPARLELEVTNHCNLRCPKCEHTYWKLKGVKERDMTLEEFKFILNQFPNLRDISMSGIGHGFYSDKFGKTFLKMVSYAKSKGLFVQFFDPFINIDEEIARQLIEIGVDRIWMSIDGTTKKTYEKLQVGSNFEKATKNVERLFELKKEKKALFPEVCFHMIVQKYNVQEMPQMVDLVLRMTKNDPSLLKHIRYTRLIPFKECSFLKPEIPKQVLDEIKNKVKKSGQLFRIGSPVFEKPQMCRCTSWTTPFITVEGTVYPCCAYTEMNERCAVKKVLEPAFGNVFNKSFKDIWYSEYFKRFRRDIVKGVVPYVCTKPLPCRIFEPNKK